jgi:hydroxymethylbilane synthase
VALVRARRPDVVIATLRGNVDTRVRRVEEGVYDAILVAAAALDRLGLGDRAAERFDERDFPPAPGQGALAVQVRAGDREIRELIEGIDDPAAREATRAERAFLQALGGGCSLAVGAFAWRANDGLRIAAVAGSAAGRLLRIEVAGSEPDALGRTAAEALLARGARDLLQ